MSPTDQNPSTSPLHNNSDQVHESLDQPYPLATTDISQELRSRMHVSIHSFIAGYYDKVPLEDQTPTADKRNRKLLDENPKLYQALRGVRHVHSDHANDNMLRFQYHDLESTVRTSRLSGSKVVLSVAPYFYSYIFPFLHRVYGDRMSQEVMIVCSYAETMAWREQVIQRELWAPAAAYALSGILTPNRKHHPRILCNGDDADIQASVVIIDPANQDGTIPGQGTFKNDQVKTAISRAVEAVVIIGNSCMPYLNGNDKTPWVDAEFALNAAHMYAHVHGGRRLKDEGTRIRATPITVGRILEPILLDEVRETLERIFGDDPDRYNDIYFAWRG